MTPKVMDSCDMDVFRGRGETIGDTTYPATQMMWVYFPANSDLEDMTVNDLKKGIFDANLAHWFEPAVKGYGVQGFVFESAIEREQSRHALSEEQLSNPLPQFARIEFRIACANPYFAIRVYQLFSTDHITNHCFRLSVYSHRQFCCNPT